MPSERVCKCGQKAIGSDPTLHRTEAGSAHFGGVETCGSVWLCPVCAAKITEGRKVDIDTVLAGHRDERGTAYMATLTIPHHRFQTCNELRKAVAGSWRRVKQGKAWIQSRDRHSWIGDVRALEVTHGANGWHPHLHILIFFRPGTSKEIMFSFSRWLFDAWAAAVANAGYGKCSENAFTWTVVDADTGAADYVGKWGAALELTKAHTKLARKNGRTPWQILQDFQESGADRDRELFREYAKAFKGARQLTWSRKFKTQSGHCEDGIRARYIPDPEPDDISLATEPQASETQVATLAKPIFDTLVSRNGGTSDVLSCLEEDGLPGVLNALRRNGIAVAVIDRPGIQTTRMVPFIVPAERKAYYEGQVAILKSAFEHPSGEPPWETDFLKLKGLGNVPGNHPEKPSPLRIGVGEPTGEVPGNRLGNVPGKRNPER